MLFAGIALAVALAVGVSAILVGTWRTTHSARKDVSAIFARTTHERETVVTREMLTHLPAPVRRYLVYAGVIGKPIPKTVRLKYTGRMRQGPDRPWMPMTAAEYYSTTPPMFIWVGIFRAAGLPIVTVTDRFQDGRGNVLVKLGGLRTVGDQTGPEMDQGAMMRYLNEMMWFPAALLGSNISWNAIDDHSAEVTLSDDGRRATASMHFDDAGRLTNFVAKRYRTAGRTYSLDAWSTPVTSYGELAGLRVPVRASGVWNLRDGAFSYIDIAVTALEYDVSKAY